MVILLARVDSIAQVTYSDSSASYIRMWCTQARKLFVDHEFTQWSERDCDAGNTVVQLETAQVRTVMKKSARQRHDARRLRCAAA
jgi:hypothetical protein